MGKKLPTLLTAALGAELEPVGFERVKSPRRRFVRRSGSRAEWFELEIVFYNPIFYVRPIACVRFDEVESIYHTTSGFEPQYQAETHTVGVDLGRVYEREGYQIPLQEKTEVALVASRLMTIFCERAEPYYQQFHNLAAVDAVINDNPNDKCIHGGLPHRRCSTGVIVAKLTGRTNYDQVVSLYHSIVKINNNGFYLSAFEALLQELEGMTAGAST